MLVRNVRPRLEVKHHGKEGRIVAGDLSLYSAPCSPACYRCRVAGLRMRGIAAASVQVFALLDATALRSNRSVNHDSFAVGQPESRLCH
jgi:hypothetical protein